MLGYAELDVLDNSRKLAIGGPGAELGSLYACIDSAAEVNRQAHLCTGIHEIVTVEGLGTMEELHPVQEAFWEAHGAQCGFCTPGILMTLVPFLQENPAPSEQEIREAISGNLCRCTGYQHVVDAAKLAADKMRT